MGTYKHRTQAQGSSLISVYRANLSFRQSQFIGDVMYRWVYDIMQCNKVVSLELAATSS